MGLYSGNLGLLDLPTKRRMNSQSVCHDHSSYSADGAFLHSGILQDKAEIIMINKPSGRHFRGCIMHNFQMLLLLMGGEDCPA